MGNFFLSMTLTECVAFYGAVIGTVSLSWNIFSGWRDKPNVNIRGMIGQISPTTLNGDKNHFFLFITNVGRRRVQITHVGGHLKSGNHFMITPNPPGVYPRILNETESFQMECVDFKHMGDVTKYFAIDSSGKYWYMSRKDFKSLLKSYKKLTVSSWNA